VVRDGYEGRLCELDQQAAERFVYEYEQQMGDRWLHDAHLSRWRHALGARSSLQDLG
jgi:hypothetical protein